jgi:hypothetical protein
MLLSVMAFQVARIVDGGEQGQAIIDRMDGMDRMYSMDKIDKMSTVSIRSIVSIRPSMLPSLRPLVHPRPLLLTVCRLLE